MKATAIFGPPGTGKTRTLLDIAGKHATDPGRILYLSFTKAAAAEAVSRIEVNHRIRPSTLHSLAFQTLNLNRAAVVDGPKLIEFGRASGIPFMQSERGADEPQEGDEYKNVLEYAANRMVPPEDAWEQFGRPGTQTRFANFVVAYNEWKRTFGYMDFDDMLTRFVEDSTIRIQADVVLLDEAQDCSPLQWMAFIKATATAKHIYIAGDDDQAIYEWTGADPHGMINWAETNEAEVRILNQSYRVPRLVWDLAHTAALNQMGQRVPKLFKPRDAKGDVDRFGGIWDIGIQLGQSRPVMVLFRDGFRLGDFKKELNRELIPYRVLGGMSPWTNKTAEALKAGKPVDIPLWWRDFYNQADLSLPIDITLSTIHQAKGREHEYVILDLGLSGRSLAGLDLNRDAELRVLYVGLTRTSNLLTLVGESPLL